jgi:purine-nucleoside phosphorylase
VTGAGAAGSAAQAAPVHVETAVAFLRERIAEAPRVGLILGSGLGDVADAMENATRFPFRDVPGFGAPGVPGHRGIVVAGRLEGVPCITLQGRRHLYEGHSADDVAFAARVLVRLGIRALIVTNAAGAINPRFRAGDLMIVDDHINLLWTNPLIGPAAPGEARFPDLAEPYDRELQEVAGRVGLEAGIRVVRGVYCAVQGPSYETPSEIRMLRFFGADAVGMSTVPEVLVARAAGVPVLGISLISNPAAGLTPEPVSHEDVIAAGARAARAFTLLLRGVVAGLPHA